MDKKSNNWIWVAVIAAVVAAVTALVVFILRARAKEKAWLEEEPIDCDLDDAECFEFSDEDIELTEIAVEE